MGDGQVQTNCSEEIVILVAEDDEASYRLMQLCLEHAGVLNKLIHFKNGEELLDFLYSRVGTGENIGRTYVLLLDINMPKVNGIEALTSIRENNNLRGISVIANSSCNDQETIDLCHSLGCIDYMVKPIMINEMMSTFESVGLKLSTNKGGRTCQKELTNPIRS